MMSDGFQRFECDMITNDIVKTDSIQRSAQKDLAKNELARLLTACCNILQVWLVGDGWDEEEQMKAAKGTLFIPFSHFPPKKMRNDCFYQCTPAMIAPPSLTNMHSCEVSIRFISLRYS